MSFSHAPLVGGTFALLVILAVLFLDPLAAEALITAKRRAMDRPEVEP